MKHRSTLCALILAAGVTAPAAADETPPDGPVRVGATPVLDARSTGVGAWIPDVDFRDIEGRDGRLSELVGPGAAPALVVALRDADCPLSRRYGPRLAALEAELGALGVPVLCLNVSEHDDAEAMRGDRERFGFTGRYVGPGGRALARGLQPRTTTEVILLDAARTVRFRGAIDDQYGIGFARPVESRSFLRDAVDALLAGAPIDVEATSAPGCLVAVDPLPAAAGDVTYHNTISRIVQARCQSCHRAGGVGPFGLERYEEVHGRRRMIRFVVEENVMPPWGATDEGGPWKDDLRLTDRERAALLAWIDAGGPEGDPADAPLPRAWPTDEWALGAPDVAYAVPTTYRVPADGALDYQYDYVKTDLDRDRWIQAIEIVPTAPQVVHHVLVFIEPPEGFEGRNGRRARQSGLRGYFAALVPGQGPTVFPEGFGKRLPKGSWLKFQIHYTPNGEEAFDRPKVGLHFMDEAPRHHVRTGAVVNDDFTIPPGASNHVVTAKATFRRAGTIMGFAPHMHLRGTGFRYELETPDGNRRIVCDVPRYDFNWQLMYRPAEPIRVEPGTTMHCTAWFDNSPDNPANPNADVPVHFGEQTWDEMMIGYFEWYRDED